MKKSLSSLWLLALVAGGLSTPSFAQSWQNALGSGGTLNVAEFPVCDFRLNIVSLSSGSGSSTSSSPAFRIFNLVHAAGTLSSSWGVPPTGQVSPQLITAVTAAEHTLLSPFIRSPFQFNRSASLVVRPTSNGPVPPTGPGAAGFTVQLVGGAGPGGAPASVTGDAQNTFLLEKRCLTGVTGGSSLTITGSGFNRVFPPTPPSQQSTWQLRASFEFPAIPVSGPGANTFMARIAVVIPGIGYAGSASFTSSSSFVQLPGGPPTYITLNRNTSSGPGVPPTGPGGTSNNGWTGSISVSAPAPGSPGGPDFRFNHTILIAVFRQGPNGEVLLGSTTFAAPHQP